MLLSRFLGAATVVAFVVLLVVGLLQVDDAPRTEPAGDPVEELIDAYRRSRSATYRASGVFTRTADDGRSLSAQTEIAQRPPDRLLLQFGSVSGRRDDRELTCPAPVDGGELECSLGPPGADFEEVVAAEVAAFASLVSGPDPLYVVEGRSAECWRMTRTRYDPRAGFGVRAELCVDPEVGALRRLEIDHGEIVEVTEWPDRTGVVRDADLEP